MKEKRYRTPKDNNKILKHRFNIYLNKNEYIKVKEFCQSKNITISAFKKKYTKCYWLLIKKHISFF